MICALNQVILNGMDDMWGVQASGSHLDLDRVPYVLYGVKYIGLVSLACPPTDSARTLCWSASGSHLDLDRAPYVLYGVKHIDLVSPLRCGPNV